VFYGLISTRVALKGLKWKNEGVNSERNLIAKMLSFSKFLLESLSCCLQTFLFS